MLVYSRLLVVMALAAASCSRAPAAREYELKGQILAVRPERNEVVIRHEDVKGFMPGMTMPFRVKEAGLLSGKEPGDLVTATLVVAEVDAHLSALTKTGHAALLEAPPPEAPDILQLGATVADARLVDQDAMPRTLSSLRGHRVALTFIYTRCPLPDFCPLMDRHFQAVQREIKKTPALADVRLVSVSFDPQFDTPPVMKAHAERLEADPLIWTFVTGDREEITRFAARFGVAVERAEKNPIDITHNLRTAVIDAVGRLVKIHTGTSCTPADLLADLKATPAATN
jgi:protein SCO1/2